MKQKGFTIIETLVAIAILMIAIAGPLTIATKALTASVDARNQLIGGNLAQEAMEYIKNTKDNNVINGSDTIAGALIGMSPSCSVDLHCGTSPIQPDDSTFATCQQFDSCKLSITSRGYTHDSSGIATPFTRYYFFTPVTNNSVLDEHQMLVTVVVEWVTGTVPNEIRLSELLTDAQR